MGKNSLKNNYLNPLKYVNREFNDAAYMNTSSYDDYFTRLSLLALSIYEWENVPETMNARFLEKTLFENGIGCIVNDSDFGIINLKVTPGGALNIYEEPTSYTAYSIGYSKMYNADDISIVRNNIMNYPTCYVISRFALRLYEIDVAASININAQKFSNVVIAPDSLQLSYKNAMLQFAGGEPFIFANKNFDVEAIKEIKNNVPLILSDLTLYKHDLLNEIYTFFGLKNANMDKKERVVSAEVNANYEIVDMSVASGLEFRKEAALRANYLFDTNIDVKLRKYNMEDILRYVYPSKERS